MSLLKYIEDTLKERETFLYELAVKNVEYAKVSIVPFEDLPTLMDTGTSLLNDLVSARLKGEDLKASKYTIRATQEVELDMELYQGIGYHNGVLNTLADLANMQGYDNLSKKALEMVYD